MFTSFKYTKNWFPWFLRHIGKEARKFQYKNEINTTFFLSSKFSTKRTEYLEIFSPTKLTCSHALIPNDLKNIKVLLKKIYTLYFLLKSAFIYQILTKVQILKQDNFVVAKPFCFRSIEIVYMYFSLFGSQCGGATQVAYALGARESRPRRRCCRRVRRCAPSHLPSRNRESVSAILFLLLYAIFCRFTISAAATAAATTAKISGARVSYCA
jgi:hypothetical protein